MASFERQGVSDRLSRKFKSENWKFGLLWALLNLGFALMVLLDIYNGATSRYLFSISPLFFYLESLLTAVFFINFLYDTAVYVRIRWMTPLQVSKQEQALLGINPKRDRGFVEKKEVIQPKASSSPQSPFSAANFFISSSPRISPSSPQSGVWSSSSTYSPSSLAVNVSENSFMSTATSSWDYFDGDFVSKRNQSSFFNNSPMKTEDLIADDNSLSRFLRCERGAGDESLEKDLSFNTSSSPVLWNQSAGQQTLAAIKTPRYQLSTRSPKSNSSNVESELTNPQNGTLVWSKFGVSVDRLVAWNENLRKWISKTIISRIVLEISAVNDLLRWQGTPEVQIGEVSLNALKLRAKGQHMPSLITLLKYLDTSSNQEYLVQRLKELERGGCLGDFRWNSGGDYKGKPWADHLPTDSAIIMHMFFTYLDTHSPLSFSFPESRSVTLKHFIQTPEKLDTSSKDALYIYQSSLHPPHYQLVVGETVYELQKGRNNIFNAMLLFLYHIKVKEDGILRRINLGTSGLNILWVMSD